MSMWGQHHFDAFFKYGLPSLMTLGNLPALSKKYDIGINVHTDRIGAQLLSQVDLPLMVYSDVTDEEKYHQLGRHQHKDLKAAKVAGADYHLLMPDFVYSEDCFVGVMRVAEKGHKAIARLVLSTVEETICTHLNKYLSATDLATLSLQHTHPGVKHWFMTKDGYPNTHVLAWETEHTLHMHSPHCTPVYIANDAIKIDDTNLPLDCILDKVIEGDIYLPKPEDGIVIIEISPESSREMNDKRLDLIEFLRILWSDTRGNDKQLQIFNEETVDPINRALLNSKYWNDVDIDEQRRIITKGIIGE